MKDIIKNKVKSSPSVHQELIDPVNKNTNVDVDVNVNVNKKKKKRFEDMHTRATFYVANDLLDKINKEVDGERGEKTRIINEALRMYFTTPNR
jgi:hypothetical protein